MHALVMHRYHGQLAPKYRNADTAAKQAEHVHEICFSKDIKKRYQISGITIEVNTLVAIKDSRLILTPNVTDQ